MLGDPHRPKHANALLRLDNHTGHALERFYKSFYFRPGKIFELVAEMSTSWEMTQRRLGFAAKDVSLIYYGLDWWESRLATTSALNPAAEPVAAQ